ncbi:MAG: extracellular solute-binding protein [Candidatus Latescibacteria bacterium]|nr:extracellular solute-binding protein [Candidatus Latescibacterota bacterium]
MKYVFLGLIALLIAMYAYAVSTIEILGDPNRTTIMWATDPNPARTKQVRIFEDLNPGLEALVDKSDATKLIVRCATGTGPDVVDIYDVFDLATFAEAGILMDLTPFADSLGFGRGNTYASLYEGLGYDGKQYRYPCNVHANVMVYNKKILADHGAPLPQPDWTWDDFIASALAVRNNPSQSGEQHIPFANWNSEWVYRDLLVGHGGDFFTDDGLRSRLSEEAAVRAMEVFRDMALTHDIMPTSAEALTLSSQGGWGSGGIAWFFNQQAAYIHIGRWAIVQIPVYIDRNPDIVENIAAARLPRVSGHPSRGVVGSRAAGINAKSNNPVAAKRFLQYLADRDYSALIVADGDALPPNPAMARTGTDLVNDIVPDPAFHQPFIDAVEEGVTLRMSPFIEAQIVKRWTLEAVQEVENGGDPRATITRVAAEIDERIRQNLRRRPALREKYQHVTGEPYRKDWWQSDVAAR